MTIYEEVIQLTNKMTLAEKVKLKECERVPGLPIEDWKV